MAKKTGGIKYNQTTRKSTKAFKLDSAILQSEESVPNLRKEIQRVFHAANRRLQNIENAGVFSPAAEALRQQFDDRQNLSNFAKFSLQGRTWTEIKIAYAQAVEFLSKPTSTASGARTFERQILSDLREEHEITDFQFKHIKQKIFDVLRNTGNFSDDMRIWDIIKSDYERALTLFEQALTNEQEQLNKAENDINNITDLQNPLLQDLKQGYMDISENDMNVILDGFEDFGM